MRENIVSKIFRGITANMIRMTLKTPAGMSQASHVAISQTDISTSTMNIITNMVVAGMQTPGVFHFMIVYNHFYLSISIV